MSTKKGDKEEVQKPACKEEKPRIRQGEDKAMPNNNAPAWDKNALKENKTAYTLRNSLCLRKDFISKFRSRPPIHTDPLEYYCRNCRAESVHFIWKFAPL